MGGFARAFDSFPPISEIQQIPGPFIVRTQASKALTPSPAGYVIIAGEFSKGAPNVMVECPTEGAFLDYFGDYDSALGAADGINGNGHLAVKRGWKGLICVGVNQKVGEISISRDSPLDADLNFLAGRFPAGTRFSDGATSIFALFQDVDFADYELKAVDAAKGAGDDQLNATFKDSFGITKELSSDDIGKAIYLHDSGVTETGWYLISAVNSATLCTVTTLSGGAVTFGAFTAQKVWLAVATSAITENVAIRALGTYTCIIGAIDTLVAGQSLFQVANLTITNAVATTTWDTTEINTAYQSALDATLKENALVYKAKGVLPARYSDIINQKARANALAAFKLGMQRIAFTQSLGATTDANVIDRAGSEAGSVGICKSGRVAFSHRSFSQYIDGIGEIDVPAAWVLASIFSRLDPEENPGQGQTLLQEDGITGIGSDCLNAASEAWERGDYQAFTAAKICVPFASLDGITQFFDGQLSDDDLGDGTINELHFGDWIAQSILAFGLPLTNKNAKPEVLSGVRLGIVLWLDSLKSAGRIIDYTSDFTQTTAAMAKKSIIHDVFKVEMNPDMRNYGVSLQVERGVPSVTIS